MPSKQRLLLGLLGQLRPCSNHSVNPLALGPDRPDESLGGRESGILAGSLSLALHRNHFQAE